MAIYFTQNTNNVEDIEQMNNVINKVNKVNTEATSNIGQLTDLNNKAQELSNNIQQALPINTELKENIKIGQPLVQEAVSKNTELQASLEKTKKFIDGLDGSQNIPQIRLDVDALQNGFKSNQALAYTGSSISADNTLEGRTEGMVIKGRTLINVINKGLKSYENLVSGFSFEDNTLVIRGLKDYKTLLFKDFTFKSNTTYTLIADIKEINFSQDDWRILMVGEGDGYGKKNSYPQNPTESGLYKATFKTPNAPIITVQMFTKPSSNGKYAKINSMMVLEGDWIDKKTPEYLEGIKSFGELEQSEGKYKINILSHGKNLFNKEKMKLGYYINDTGSEVSDDGLGYYDDFISCKKDDIFYIDICGCNRIYLYDKNKKLIKRELYNNKTKYIISANAHYFNFQVIKKTYSENYNNQITFGDNVTLYQPYKQDKKELLLKSPLHEGDYLCENNGQVKIIRDMLQNTFNGSDNEKWTLYNGSETNPRAFWIELEPKFTNTLQLICDRFPLIRSKEIDGVWQFDSKGMKMAISDNNSKYSTVEDFKKNLKVNPITICYKSPEKIVEILDSYIDIDLNTYQDKTYFSIENSLPGILDFKVPSNIASIVQNTAREVNNIWDVINNLLVPSLIDINKNVAMSTIKNNLK